MLIGVTGQWTWFWGIFIFNENIFVRSNLWSNIFLWKLFSRNIAIFFNYLSLLANLKLTQFIPVQINYYI